MLFLPLAKLDIREAALWYKKQESNLGIKFTTEVRRTIKFIQENPTSIAIRYNNVRTVILDIFPFMIHYAVDDIEKIIIISGVYHTSLNPETWKKR